MKSRMLLMLAGVLVVSMLVISPVSAEKVIYRANGTLDEYNDPFYNGSIIFQGSWRIKIEDNEVNFKACYLEENINEENNGTLDKFKLILTEVENVNIDDSVCVIWGTLVWYKIGWDSPDYQGYPPGNIYFNEFSMFLKITIDSSGILIGWDPPEDPVIGIQGSTLSIQY